MAGERINNIWDMIFDRQNDYQPTMQQEVDYANYMANQPNAQPTQAPVMATQPVSDRQVVDLGRPSVVNNDIPTTVANTQSPVVDVNIPQPETPQPETPQPVEEPSFMDKASDFFNEERMARMTIALNSMRLNPDPNIAKSMELKLDRLQKRKASTKTSEALRNMGRTDLADLVDKGVMDGKTAYGLAFKAPSALQEKIDLYTKDPEKFAQLKEAGVLGSGGTTVNVGGQEMTPGWKKIDERFADDYIKWTGGGGADTAGNIAKLQDVLGKLESGEKLTGPIMGQMPDFIMAFLDPDAVGSREAVEGVVQRNLKAVLGAQFTEKEGEKLIKRAYNPTLGGAENARRLRVLTKQMVSALQSKNEMSQYFRDKGTLMGYNGRIPQINDFWAALEGLKIGQKVGNKTYVGGDPKLQSSYK